MKTTITNLPAIEPAEHVHQHVICWKSIITGVLISGFTFLILSALGAGIFGSMAQNVIEKESGGQGLFTGAGLYLGISTVIALFVGGYFAVRVSGYVTAKVGIAHGFVIASIFFILFVIEMGSAVGALSKGVAKMIGTAGEGTAIAANNPQVQDAIQNAIGNSQLKSDTDVVIQGVTARLLQGDTESAKNYLAYQTNQTPADVDAKIVQLKANFEAAAKVAADKAAVALADTGWSLLLTFAVGLLGSIIGGIIGAESNFKKPLAEGSTEVRVSSSHLLA